MAGAYRLGPGLSIHRFVLGLLIALCVLIVLLSAHLSSRITFVVLISLFHCLAMVTWELPSLPSDSQDGGGKPTRQRLNTAGAAAIGGGAANPDASMQEEEGVPRRRRIRKKKGDAQKAAEEAIGEAPLAKKLEKGTKQMFQVIIKSSLQLQQQQRCLLAIVIDMIVLPAEGTILTALSDTGRRYAHACEEKGKNHGLGPPQPRLWLSLCQALSKMEVGRKNQELLKAHIELFQSFDLPTACRLVRMVKVCKMFDDGKKKLWLFIDDFALSLVGPPMRATVLSAIAQTTDARVLTGVAPPGKMENMLSAWLEKLDSKG